LRKACRRRRIRKILLRKMHGIVLDAGRDKVRLNVHSTGMESHAEPDEILIRGLELWSQVGVPDAEIASPQRLLADISIRPKVAFEALGDDIAATIDYDELCRRLSELAASRPRRLIETLAADLASVALAEYPAISVTIEIRKFVLAQTEFVAVRCTRSIG